ncbi:MAG: tetratricopeptide repeat protein [Alphaproteobacteria bacterium]|nr:tetratricopeptide repeat protein [Alphaproteobacteria bacterium]
MRRRDFRRNVFAAALFVAGLLSPAAAFAHADIIERITALDDQILATPQDPALYLKRGELHRLHRDWPAALNDYKQAERLTPDDPAIHYYRGRMRLEADEPALARPLLDQFLAARPNHADALLIRSRALSRLGAWLAAADDLSRAIALLDPPTPEVYLERARALVAAGPENVDRAVVGLDAGIERLGPLVTLIGYGIDVERTHGRHAQALARLDTLPVQISQQPAWLATRGDILRDLGELRQAKATYRSGLDKIETYPMARRNSRATVELETRLREALQ